MPAGKVSRADDHSMPFVWSFVATKVNELNPEGARAKAMLQEMLVELALTLVPYGITPKAFTELSRYAFAYAAAQISQRSNGKVNYSRVSALTGLSRADVKNLLQKIDPAVPRRRSIQMPIERVLNGWRADCRFVDKKGDPKALKISGGTASFAYLAKLYAGDVPHRAVLDELRRIGAVHTDGVVVTPTVVKAQRGRPTLAALSSAIPVIIDGIRMASRAESSPSSPAMYRLTIPARSAVDMTILRERCLSTVTAMLDALGEALGGYLTTPRARKRQRRSFAVTVLLAENDSQRPSELRMQSDRHETRSAATKRSRSTSRRERK
jgi:hypothetical protein